MLSLVGTFSHSSGAKNFYQMRDTIYQKTNNIIYDHLCGQQSNTSMFNQWNNTICKKVVDMLSKTNHHFKYIVNCTIVQNDGHPINMRALCYWDNHTDGSCSVKWESQHLICVVNIYGCKL